VLWLSGQSFFQPARPIRGGVPVCFPWFGPHPTDKSAPAHGFARLAEWTLVEAVETPEGTVVVTFTLSGDASASPAWPHAFRIVHRISIGSRLTMALDVHNPGGEPFTFEEALHTYFTVHDIATVTIDGLADTEYLDKTSGFARRLQRDTAIRFTGETDRMYLDTDAPCIIHDSGLQRRIVVSKSGSRSTVVWNPWIDKARAMPDFGDDEWREMVCVETANVGSAAVRLEPGGTHIMSATIELR
jgi:glucose-6-phosphate 1-epimerase